jgi:hypothetical protein
MVMAASSFGTAGFPSPVASLLGWHNSISIDANAWPPVVKSAHAGASKLARRAQPLFNYSRLHLDRRWCIMLGLNFIEENSS